MTRWPEIGSEALETDLDNPIFTEDPSPEIRSDDMKDRDVIILSERRRVVFSGDKNQIDGN